MGEVVKFEPPLTAEEKRECMETLEEIATLSQKSKQIDKGYGVVGSGDRMRALERGEDAAEALFEIMGLTQAPTDE